MGDQNEHIAKAVSRKCIPVSEHGGNSSVNMRCRGKTL
jgi:hypothetical protein